MKERNITVWYVVSIVTLGIGFIVWYYVLNADAKKIAQHKGWSPALSVVAITFGGIIVIPPLVSVWRTWSRVREATNADGLSAGLQFLLCYIPIANLVYYGYLQSKLNASMRVPVAASPAPAASVA